MLQKEMAANVADYLSTEVLEEEGLSVLDLLDALATYGYSLVADEDAAIEYQAVVIEETED